MPFLTLPPLAINYPSFLSPEIIQGLPVRWYGLMYIVAFFTAFLVYRRQVRERRFPMSEEKLSMMFFWCILALLLGARIFYGFVYEPFGNPFLVLWPFGPDGQFTGFRGMSYHGGAIGGLLGIIIWSKKNKYDLREIGDMYAAAIPLGYTFGRLGNFANGELYGRVTSSPLGMIFPAEPPYYTETFSAKLGWVREMAEEAGITLTGGAGELVNLPRYPSQLYEAFFEGIAVWAIIWIFRNRKPFKGFLLGLYPALYGFFRFFIEYFREPDASLGYRIQFGEKIALKDIARFHPLTSLSTGQILCLIMIAAAILWWFIAARLPDNKPVRLYGEVEEDEIKSADEKKASQNARRKLRKKLK